MDAGDEQWEAIASQLSKAALEQGDVIAKFGDSVPNDAVWQFKALMDTGDDIFAAAQAFFWALEELKKLPVRALSVWDKIDAEDHLRIWARDLPGERRPRWTVVAMTAGAWCNALEGFIRGISSSSIDPSIVARVRGAFPDAGIDWDNLEQAKRQIAHKMLLSTRRNGQCFEYMRVAFGCDIAPEVGQALKSLVAFRNSATHPERGRRHADHQKHPCSAEWVSWANAIRVLAGGIIAALAGRLKERRAKGEKIPLFP